MAALLRLELATGGQAIDRLVHATGVATQAKRLSQGVKEQMQISMTCRSFEVGRQRERRKDILRMPRSLVGKRRKTLTLIVTRVIACVREVWTRWAGDAVGAERCMHARLACVSLRSS
eukprot:1004962-Pleurochrysis_carterae.AAC.1